MVCFPLPQSIVTLFDSYQKQNIYSSKETSKNLQPVKKICYLVSSLETSINPFSVSFCSQRYYCSVCDFILSLLHASCSSLASHQFLPGWRVTPEYRSGHACPPVIFQRLPQPSYNKSHSGTRLLFHSLATLLSGPLIQTLKIPQKYCVFFHFQTFTLADLFVYSSPSPPRPLSSLG